MKKRQMKLSQIALAMALTCSAMAAAPALAGTTGATASVQGTVPVLSAPSNGALQAVDFSGTYAVASKLSVGDTIVLTYVFKDAEGDADGSNTSVSWSYSPAGGGADLPLTSTSTPATASGGQGTSSIVLPAGALGATAIKVKLQELSATGEPLAGQTITVTDTSLSTAPGGGGGGGTTTPPGPVLPGDNVVGGIFLQSDSPAAGSSATDYSRSASVKPQVGKTYVFRAWTDINNNGTWDAGEADVTATMSSIQWHLDGSNSSASGTSTPVSLSNHNISGATTDTYTIPVNSASSSGAAPGDQGFSLRVSY